MFFVLSKKEEYLCSSDMATWKVASVSPLVYRFMDAGTTFVNYGVNVNDISYTISRTFIFSLIIPGITVLVLMKLMIMSSSSVVGKYRYVYVHVCVQVHCV